MNKGDIMNFGNLLDSIKAKVNEDFDDENTSMPGAGEVDAGADDLDLTEPQEEETTGFDQEMIQEYGLTPPKQEYEEYDQEQFQRGIEVEAEHTTNQALAAVIAANHLDEIPDYYTRLYNMEEEYKKEQGSSDIPTDTPDEEMSDETDIV